jgi:hypothetical protein
MTGLALVVGCLVAVLGFAAPALADPHPFIYFDLSNATLTYTAGDKMLQVTQSGYSAVQVELQDTSGGFLQYAIVDNDKKPNNPVWINEFNFLLAMKLTKNGPENWSATGTLAFTDTDMGTNAVEATFTSTSVRTYTGYAGELEITGFLGLPTGRDSILVNRPEEGPTWTFAGEYDTQVSIPGGLDYYSGGQVFVIKFGIPDTNLDNLLNTDRVLLGGKVEGTMVPAPAAVLLGLFGLGAVGWYMRRYA